jgi:hypothetical protein
MLSLGLRFMWHTQYDFTILFVADAYNSLLFLVSLLYLTLTDDIGMIEVRHHPDWGERRG